MICRISLLVPSITSMRQCSFKRPRVLSKKRSFLSLLHLGDSSHFGDVSVRQNHCSSSVFIVSHSNRWTQASGSCGTRHQKTRFSSWTWLQFPNCRIWGIFPISSIEATVTTSSTIKRSRIVFFRFLGMASTFQEPLSRQYFHCRRHKRIILKVAALKIPSFCGESRRITFDLSCASYIRCAFWWYSQLSTRVFMKKYFSIGQKPVVEFDEWVGVLHLSTMWIFQEVRSSLLQKISALRLKSWLRSEKEPLPNFQTSLYRRQSRKGLL